MRLQHGGIEVINELYELVLLAPYYTYEESWPGTKADVLVRDVGKYILTSVLCGGASHLARHRVSTPAEILPSTITVPHAHVKNDSSNKQPFGSIRVHTLP